MLAPHHRHRRCDSLVGATVAVLALCLVGTAGHGEQGIYSKAAPPASAADVLRTYKLIAEQQLYGRDDFYSEEALKGLFGRSEEIRISHNFCPASGSAYIFRFADFFPPPGAVPAPGIYVSASKYNKSCELLTPSLRNYLGRLNLEVQGTTAGLDFKSVTAIFGPNWVEDQEAERTLFYSIVREPWNPPPPKSTAYMGNAIIKYVTPTSTSYLRFSPDGNLANIETSAPATPQSSGKPAT